MCSLCLKAPCHPRCPNSEEPKPVYECCKCGHGIFEGEKYYDSPKGYICRDCIEDMEIEEFMEMLGEAFSIAEKEE